jgi:SPP1 family predicted phage head-tail adaptor
MPKAGTITSSNMNRRIQFQLNTPIANGDGTSSDNWQTVYSCWAKVRYWPQTRSGGMARVFAASQFFFEVTITFEIRFQTQVAITDKMHILYPAHGVNHIYKIIGMENTDEANQSLWLLCQEAQAQAVN